MLHFIRTKQKTKYNVVYYYGRINFKQFERCIIYAFNRSYFVDLQLLDNKTNDVVVDRYKISTSVDCGLLLKHKHYCKKLVTHLIFNAYEKKKLS